MTSRRFFTQVLPFYLVFTLMTSGCRKLLEAPTPEDAISSAQVFANDADAQNALAGMYIQIMNNSRSLLNGGLSLYGGLSSDELSYTGFDPRIVEFELNSLDAGNTFCTNLYTGGYNMIFTANSLIAGLAGATGMSPGVRSEMRGEAEFVRALVYFYLVNLYSGVPLVTTTDFATSAVQPRASVEAVYAQIVADLQDAEARLSVSYISNPVAGVPDARVRPNQAAATALLARVWLYQGLWKQAELAADSVLANTLYALKADPDSVFLVGSPETIWQLQPVYGNLATAEGNLFIPSGTPALVYPLTTALMESWEPGDLRREVWTDSVVIDGATMYFPYKYKLASNDPPNTEYNIVLRLAEVFLIRAEARAQQGNIAGATADLNIVRQRAGLPASDAADPGALLAAIARERRVELFAEWGHRWLDLKRTGQAGAVLSLEKQGFLGTDVLYPIPAQELTANPSLTQNAGY
jgi:hypothetical protein